MFFFQYSRNLEIFFWKNTSERLLRQLVPVSVLWLYIKIKIHITLHIKITIVNTFAIFRRKCLFWSPFLIKLQELRPATLLKRDSNTDVFLWILQNLFEKYLQTAASVHFKIKRCIHNPVKYLRCFCKKIVFKCSTGFKIHEKKLLRFYHFFIL